MSDMGNPFPINTEFETIERALHFLDTTEQTYLEACQDAIRHFSPIAITTIHLTAKNHIRAYSGSLAPLLYDAPLEEFASISHNLMTEKELKRVTLLNDLLASEVLKPLLPAVNYPFPDSSVDPHADEIIDKKIQLYTVSSNMFAEHVGVDTDLFVNRICA